MAWAGDCPGRVPAGRGPRWRRTRRTVPLLKAVGAADRAVAGRCALRPPRMSASWPGFSRAAPGTPALRGASRLSPPTRRRPAGRTGGAGPVGTHVPPARQFPGDEQVKIVDRGAVGGPSAATPGSGCGALQAVPCSTLTAGPAGCGWPRRGRSRPRAGRRSRSRSCPSAMGCALVQVPFLAVGRDERRLRGVGLVVGGLAHGQAAPPAPGRRRG